MHKTELTKSMRWYIADRLAEERLPYINQSYEEVRPRNTFYTRYGKRIFDILIAGTAIIITFPINVILCICTFIDVGRPVFFCQDRLGKDGKIFQIVKFRNMLNTKDERGEFLPPAERVTRFGKFVRRTSLDELLNFWNVLKGDMSIIGPRPLVPEYKNRYSKRHFMRMSVRPGLECPPKDELSHIRTWEEQFENDIWYVEHMSFKTDCYMIWQLIKFTLDRKNALARAMSEKGTFMGYSEDGKAINMDAVPYSYVNEIEQLNIQFEVGGTEKSQQVISA